MRSLQAPAPFEAYLIPVSAFPLPEEEAVALKSLLDHVTARVMADSSCSVEVFAQMTQFHDSKNILRKYRDEWIPQLGLGVWPHRPPPTMWTRADFLDLGPDEKPRPLMYQLLRIGAPGQPRDRARYVLLGLGALLQVLAPDSAEFLAAAREGLLPTISEPIQRSFPFYAPL